MLVLTRRAQEQIVFPELGITVEVNRISGNRVRLGISAPDDIKIVRGELAFDSPEDRRAPAPSPVVFPSSTHSHCLGVDG